MEEQNLKSQVEIENLSEQELEEAAGGLCSLMHCSNTTVEK